MKDRLTDEKWQRLLKQNAAPPPPEWTRFFKVREAPKGGTTAVRRRHWGC